MFCSSHNVTISGAVCVVVFGLAKHCVCTVGVNSWRKITVALLRVDACMSDRRSRNKTNLLLSAHSS